MVVRALGNIIGEDCNVLRIKGREDGEGWRGCKGDGERRMERVCREGEKRGVKGREDGEGV